MNETSNLLPGNAASATFTSNNGSGFITVSHQFQAGGVGVSDNADNLLFPSQFTTLFPGTGSVRGHLAQTVYGFKSIITFDLTNYAMKPTTAFGIWNTSDEVAQPDYKVQLLDASNNIVSPTTFNLIGDQDNTGAAGVAARHVLTMNTSTGDLSAGALLNPSGTHTDAAFWNNIPFGTKQIIVTSNLAQLNTIGDGVGYYFVEAVPEPSSIALMIAGLISLAIVSRRQAR
ncbi:MAG TPA: PEP-CTERM sorting domain-containing protein [Tepidisphaeraceae bacterium]|nr:PEP-CTERM sorting domain-containing protein [Tepidisphaeraceae bacterium]